MTEKLEEDDVVLCTVKRIEGTTVFLEAEVNSHIIQGTMIFSEVSPGRIRNIREYVSPGKKIVCKVLRIKAGHPELSLRRVTAGEREYITEKHKKENILTNSLKPVLGENTPSILQKIKEKYELSDFLDEARENPKIIEKYVTKSQAEQLAKIFAEKKEKEKQVKITFLINSQSESGLKDIQKVLDIRQENAEIYYLGSSKFTLSIRAKSYRDANAEMETLLEEIKEKAKKLNVNLEVKENKK